MSVDDLDTFIGDIIIIRNPRLPDNPVCYIKELFEVHSDISEDVVEISTKEKQCFEVSLILDPCDNADGKLCFVVGRLKSWKRLPDLFIPLLIRRSSKE